jgi:hypothetical protein
MAVTVRNLFPDCRRNQSRGVPTLLENHKSHVLLVLHSFLRCHQSYKNLTMNKLFTEAVIKGRLISLYYNLLK